MVRDESIEETSGHSEVPIQVEVTFDPEAAKEFLEVVDSVKNEAELSEASIRTLGEAVVNFSGTVRPKK